MDPAPPAAATRPSAVGGPHAGPRAPTGAALGGRLARAALLALLALGLASLSGCATLLPGLFGEPKSRGHARPADVDHIPDAVPKDEPLSRYGNPNTYVVFGKRYNTMKSAKGFQERGVASWYGPDFHGKRTSSGEEYDMYTMTAAHKTLPIPTYLEVVNLRNGRRAVVRVNDRGPFHDDRILDLSYVAARKLGVDQAGTSEVQIRAVAPGEPLPADQAYALAPAPAPAPRSASQQPIPGRLNPPSDTGAGAPVLGPSAPALAQAVAAAPRPATLQAQAAPAAPRPAAQAQAQAVADLAPPGNGKAGADPLAYFLQLGAFSDRHNAERLRGQLPGGLGGKAQIKESAAAGRPIYRVQIGPLPDGGSANQVVEQLAQAGIRDHRVVYN
jgi:rare lipoprotein A